MKPTPTIDRITLAFNAATTRQELRKELQAYRLADLTAWLRVWRGSPYGGLSKSTKIEIICGLSRRVQESERRMAA